MTSPRRRVLRPEPVAPLPDLRRIEVVERRRTQLAHERDGFERWMTRLRRACREVEKRQRKIARLERALTRLQQN